MAKLEEPSQLSSQNLIFLPSPILQLKPNFAALAAHITPLKKEELLVVLEYKILCCAILYLKSRISLKLPTITLISFKPGP
jgi:hypothetical protein